MVRTLEYHVCVVRAAIVSIRPPRSSFTMADRSQALTSSSSSSSMTITDATASSLRPILASPLSSSSAAPSARAATESRTRSPPPRHPWTASATHAHTHVKETLVSCCDFPLGTQNVLAEKRPWCCGSGWGPLQCSVGGDGRVHTQRHIHLDTHAAHSQPLRGPPSSDVIKHDLPDHRRRKYVPPTRSRGTQ